ncbi:MAG: hypothetical protein OXU72_05930 [Gammaproteobacteria bacterium]|nr:hypothetical protein [Gammaproteobacteria bacterium]
MEETYSNMAAGVTSNPRQPSLPPTIPERTYLNVDTAARLRVEEPYMKLAKGVTRKPQQPSLPPTVPERTYLNVATAANRQAQEIRDAVASAAGPNGPRARALPPVPGRSQGNPGAAADAEEEAIYDEIAASPATSPQQPVQWRRRPVAQKMGGAAASDGLQPDQPLTGHSSDPVRAYQRLALAHLRAVGIEDPELELVRLYRRHLPEETPFDRQVRLDAESHQEAARKHAYLQAIFEIAAGNSMLYDDLSRHVDVDEARRYLGGRIYGRYEARAKPFVGPTAADYLRSFDNQPEGIHKRVFRDALESGLSHALGTGPAPLPLPDDATRL